MRCTGGNGARADGLGTSIFCTELYTGESVKYRRASVLGILKEDCYPAWLTDILKNIKKVKKNHIRRLNADGKTKKYAL
ncbi:MAG: hypothetical protein L6V93_12985 [Clostridiales bacterium]|nr:MAG: hypothetical protein L6V93_12985 [Clostridiales bacterium]